MDLKEKALIILPKQLSKDIIISVDLLTDVIKDRSFDILANEEAEDISRFSGNWIRNFPKRTYNLEIKTHNTDVKDINWSKSQDGLNLEFEVERGVLLFDQLSATMKNIYREIIIIGIEKFREISTIYNQNKDYFSYASVVTIASEGLFDENEIKEENFNFIQHSAAIEDVYLYLKKKNFQMSPEQCSLVLAGIMQETSNFSVNIDRTTYLNAAELLSKGASNEVATRLLQKYQE